MRNEQRPTLLGGDDLPTARQLALREDYGRYHDRLPPTCSLETKIVRFTAWLAERGIRYRHLG